MELPVPVWDLKLEQPDVPVEFISPLDPEEYVTGKAMFRLPLELPVPCWSTNSNHKAPTFSIKLLEEEEGARDPPQIARTSPMVLPLFPWNVNSRFCAASGLLEPYSSTSLPLNRDIVSPEVISQSNPTPSLSMMLESPTSSTPSQFSRSSHIEPTILPNLSIPPNSGIHSAPQLSTLGGISTSQMAPANQTPAYREASQTLRSFENPSQPAPRYDIQIAPHLSATLGSTAQPPYDTVAPSHTQEAPSVPADESIPCSSSTERPQGSSVEETRSPPPKTSLLPPVPQLGPMDNEIEREFARTPANGPLKSQSSPKRSCLPRVSPISAPAQSEASPDIGSFENQVFPSKAAIPDEVIPAVGSVRRQVLPEPVSVQSEITPPVVSAVSAGIVSASPGSVPTWRQEISEKESAQEQVSPDFGTVENEDFSSSRSFLRRVFAEIVSVLGPGSPQESSNLGKVSPEHGFAQSQVVPELGAIQDHIFHDIESIQKNSSETTALPPFVSSFPNQSVTAPLKSSKTTSESQPTSKYGGEQAPVSMRTTPSAMPSVPFGASCNAIPQSDTPKQSASFNERSPPTTSDISTPIRTNCSVNTLPVDSFSLSQASTASNPVLSTVSESLPGSLTVMQTYERKRHIPLLPTPTFSSSRQPKSTLTTKYRNIINSKNQQRVYDLPPGSGASFSKISATASTSPVSAAMRTTVFKRPLQTVGPSEYSDFDSSVSWRRRREMTYADRHNIEFHTSNN